MILTMFVYFQGQGKGQGGDKFRSTLSEYITLDLPSKRAKKPLIALLSSYFLIFMAINLVFLIPIITADIPEDENIQIYNMSKQVALVPSNHTVTYNFGVMDRKSFDVDTHFIVLVLLVGSLGSLIHGIAKLSQNTQDGLVKQRDSLWYISRPFLGATLAIVVYMVFRGGLLITSDIQILNPYGVAALALLADISTKQVTQKLKDMLESVLPTKSQESSD